MKPKRVLIVDIGSLLIEAAESVLKRHESFTVVNIFPRDIGALMQAVERINPDVIVMDEDTYLIEPMRLFASLGNMPSIRVIVLNKRGSFVNIYDKQECAILDPSQLIDAIQLDRHIPGAK